MSVTLYIFLYKGSPTAKWLAVVLCFLAGAMFVLIVFQLGVVALVVSSPWVALYSTFAALLIWSRPVNSFLEEQRDRSWGEAGGIVPFLALGAVGLAAIVVPRFFGEGPTAAWRYTFPESGVEITLPSRGWTAIRMQGTDAAFRSPKHPALVGVNLIPGREAEYQKRVRDFRDYFARVRAEMLSEPQIEEGVTTAGDPYILGSVKEKTSQGKDVLVARSIVWCKDRDLIVLVLLEGQLVMQSKVGKVAEEKFFLGSAKSITMSVE